jgi:phage/plasmid-like protein (TIGR03299 family)
MTQPGQPGYDPTINDWGTQYDVAENKLTHGIDETVTGGAFASVRNPAWHRLGVVFEEQVTADRLLKAAYADYEVFHTPCMTVIDVPVTSPSGEPLTIGGEPMMKEERANDTTKRNICRRHPETGVLQILGQSAPGYKLRTNREVFVEFADKLLDLATPNVSTCGVLYEGRQAFMSWQLSKDIMVNGEDAAELWLMAHTSHDGSRPTTLAIVPIRTVCQNTLRVGLAGAKTRWAIRHTKNSKLVLAEVREALKLSYSYAEDWTTMATDLARSEVTTAEFDALIRQAFAPKEDAGKKALDAWDERRGALLDTWAKSATTDGIRGTAWGAINAVTEFYDWSTKVQRNSFETHVEGPLKVSDPDGYRFWRSLDGEKSIEKPKQTWTRRVIQFVSEDLSERSHELLKV